MVPLADNNFMVVETLQLMQICLSGQAESGLLPSSHTRRAITQLGMHPERDHVTLSLECDLVIPKLSTLGARGVPSASSSSDSSYLANSNLNQLLFFPDTNRLEAQDRAR